MQNFSEIREVYEKEIIRDLIGSAGRLQTHANSLTLKEIAVVINTCHERLQKLILACEIIEDIEEKITPQQLEFPPPVEGN